MTDPVVQGPQPWFRRRHWIAAMVGAGIIVLILVAAFVDLPESTDSRRSRAVTELHLACADVYRGLLADDLDIPAQESFLANAQRHAVSAGDRAGGDDRLLAVVNPIREELDVLAREHDSFPRLPIFLESSSSTSTLRADCEVLSDSGL